MQKIQSMFIAGACLILQIGVTVLDRNGIPQAVLRNTVAPPVTLEISRGKAYAAVMFNTPTSQLGDRAATPIGRVAGVVMSSGGLPVQVGGNLLGAQAGLDAVLDDLEMAD